MDVESAVLVSLNAPVPLLKLAHNPFPSLGFRGIVWGSVRERDLKTNIDNLIKILYYYEILTQSVA